MRSTHPYSSIHALYRVFVNPALSKQQVSTTLSRYTYPPAQHTQCFSRRATSRPPEAHAQKRDSDIKARVIHLVDPATGRLSEEGPRTTYDVLNSLDTKTHRLVQLSPDEPGNRDFVPVCKIVDKQEAWEADRKRKVQAKVAKKSGAKSGDGGMKTLEINWAIDENDLSHRLDRMREFLEEGRRVEIALAAKRRGRKATLEECENVLKKIKDTVEDVDGAKERLPLEGKLGKSAMIVFQGRPSNLVSDGGSAVESDGREESKKLPTN